MQDAALAGTAWNPKVNIIAIAHSMAAILLPMLEFLLSIVTSFFFIYFSSFLWYNLLLLIIYNLLTKVRKCLYNEAVCL